MPRTASARAFGIDVTSEFPLGPALPASGGTAAAPTELLAAGPEAIDSDWPFADAVRVEEFRMPSGELGLAIDEHAEAGYRLDAGVYGLYRLSPDGLRALCSVDGVEPWRRARFLTARVLPLAATLRGLEVFHAGCVGVDGHGVAFMGASHAGKTSMSVQMALQGAAFLSDDLMALEGAGGGVLAHPGAGLAGLRHAEFELLEARRLRRLGEFEDRGDKVWLNLARSPEPVPLRVVYLLWRAPDVDELAFRPVTPLDPRELLASSFFRTLALKPDRLVNQLSVCSNLAATASMFWAEVPTSVGSAALASKVRAHLETLLAPERAA